jgi:hypothetical protein
LGAFVLSAGLFLFWLVVGRALLSLLHSRRNPLQDLLLAPAAGLTCTLIPVFALNRAGLPVAAFGVWLGLGLLLAAAAVLLWRRPPLALGHYSPFAGVLLLGLFLAGRPLLEFGFDWVSCCNGDTTYYCLAVQRSLAHGFFEFPSGQDLLEGRDYSLYTWFFHPWFDVRVGSEMVMAWVCSVTGLSPLQIFMPVIVAFHGVLISAAGALVCRTRDFRRVALVACALLAVSPQNTQGPLYQVIGQVSGIALLAAAAAVLLRPFTGMSRRAGLAHGVLAGILGAGQVLFYPEATPFLALGFALYHLAALRRRGLPWRQMAPILGVAVVVGALCMQGYLVGAVRWILIQNGMGASTAGVPSSKFPYFLMPTGLPTLWGLLPLGGTAPEPWLSASVLVGLQLLLALAAAAVWLTWRGHASATLTLVMLAMGGYLFAQQLGFGLFKLAMFIQPFLIATLVTAWFRLFPGGPRRAVPLWLLAGLGLLTQTAAVESTRGVGPGSRAEIPQASSARVMGQFREAIRPLPEGQLILGTNNFALARFQALYTQGRPALFPGFNYFERECHALDEDAEIPRWADRPAVLALCQALRDRVVPRRFDLHDPDNPDAVNPFDQVRIGEVGPEPRKYVVAEGPLLTVLNRWHPAPGPDRAFRVRPLEDVHNHLLFTASGLGQIAHFGGRDNTGLHRLENDILVPGQNMAGTGRHQLYQVLNPSAAVRLVLALSSTLKGDGENRLPPAAVIGEGRERFDVVGRGSARLISPPLVPQRIGGRDYLGVDLGVGGTGFATQKSGLQNLYGKGLQADQRAVVCFARDISLISEEEYQRLTPPSKLVHFPDDLMNPHLEYSGICEDGWASSACYFYLTQGSEHRHLVVGGLVPGMSRNPHFTTELRVLVDGKECLRERLSTGEFRLCADAPPGMGRRRVDLRFSADQQLPAPDNRPMAALLNKIGFMLESEDLTADNDEEDGQ